eukprot:scaffold1386_cov342-Pavlova_lutheri.AAC.17
MEGELRVGPTTTCFAMARPLCRPTRVGAALSASIDDRLMSPPTHYGLQQLMELAGLSVASSIREVYVPSQHPRVLVLCGPGNNGGDGLVAARHLRLFGYDRVDACCPKTKFTALQDQCLAVGVSMRDVQQVQASVPWKATYDLVVDALFGFSFKKPLRSPYDVLVNALLPSADPPKIACVDVPSGWDVDEGDVDSDGIRPDMLVSLTAPKKCADHFKGQYHYLGGRFVPPALQEEFQLEIPEYPGSQQCVQIL